MEWKLKSSSVKGAKKVCVLKLERNNLSGSFATLNTLGNNEFSYKPTEVGLYRVVNNVDRSQKAIKGCQLVYQIEGETFLRRLRVQDVEVSSLPSSTFSDGKLINDLAVEIRKRFK